MSALTAEERENHVCCVKRRLCKDEHFHERDILRIVEARTGALRSALERTQTNFILAVAGKPVRDMAETLAENRAALAPATSEPTS